MIDLGTEILRLLSGDPIASKAAEALDMAGGSVYVVGGAPRDALLGKRPKDLDLLVRNLDGDAVRTALEQLPGKVTHNGADFAVFRYAEETGRPVEIALPRVERSTGDGHKDFEVSSDPTLPIEDDLLRRDFTCNAIAVRVEDGDVIDPFNAAHDIAQGVLRVIAADSFSDDPLRIMRGLVARARHGLVPEPRTFGWMTEYAWRLRHLPVERCRDELDKLMESIDPAAGIMLARDVGALGEFLPDVAAAVGFDQRNRHHELDLGEHLLSVLRHLATVSEDKDLRLAALLHDIGKPASAWEDPETGDFHYYEKHLDDGTVLGARHEDVGAEMARRWMLHMKYATERMVRVTGLVRHHMYAGFTTEAGARRFLGRVGNLADDLFTLRWADQGGKFSQPHKDDEPAWNLERNLELAARVRSKGQAFDRAGLVVNGADLIAIGIQPGPEMGAIIAALVESVIEDPAANERAALLATARAHTTEGPKGAAPAPEPRSAMSSHGAGIARRSGVAMHDPMHLAEDFTSRHDGSEGTRHAAPDKHTDRPRP